MNNLKKKSVIIRETCTACVSAAGTGELGRSIRGKIESDPNAQGFYERMGAKVVGEHVGEVEGQPRILPVLEVILTY